MKQVWNAYLSGSVHIPDGEQIAPWSRLCPNRLHHDLPTLIAGANEHAFEDRDDVFGGHDAPMASASFTGTSLVLNVAAKKKQGVKSRSKLRDVLGLRRRAETTPSCIAYTDVRHIEKTMVRLTRYYAISPPFNILVGGKATTAVNHELPAKVCVKNTYNEWRKRNCFANIVGSKLGSTWIRPYSNAGAQQGYVIKSSFGLEIWGTTAMIK